MNVMIIDDEPHILRTIYDQLAEMELEISQVDMANSAAQARPFLKKRTYDIFLCDIQMPEEDGIHFARWVLKQYPESIFIFLTAHADYEYMKEAISMRSFDYILQPVEKEELRNVLERARIQLSIERKNRKLISLGSFFSDHETELLNDQAGRFLLSRTKDDSYLKRMILENTEFSFEELVYFPFFVQILKSDKIWDKEDKMLLYSIYRNIVDEVMEQLATRNVVVLFDEKNGDFAVLLCKEKGCVPEFDKVLEILENLRHIFNKIVNIEIGIYYIGFCGFRELPESFERILREKDNNVRALSRVYRVEEQNLVMTEVASTDTRIASWELLLSQNRLIDFRDSLFRYLDQMTESDRVNREWLQKLHQRISELILSYMVSMEINSGDIFREEFTFYQFVYQWNTISDLKILLAEVTDRLYEYVNVPGEDVIQMIIRYIRQNIGSELVVSEIANRVGMNPDYLTRVFKKKTGMNLKRYIDNEKMKVAKTLLTTTELPVTIVADHVGYTSYSNFTRSFKAMVGCTPSEFRERSNGI